MMTDRIQRASGAGGYVLAVVATSLAVGVRWLVDGWLGDTAPLVMLYGAIAAVVGFAGLRPAIAAAIVGYLACAYLFIEPRGALAIQNARDAERLALYLVTSSIIIGVGKALRVARNRAEVNWQCALDKQNQLEAEIVRRTQAECALRDADQNKDEFLAMLAHELRNPLAAAQYALQLLHETGRDSTLAQEAQTILERQIVNLMRLVDDLLDIARVSNGKVRLQKRCVDLVSVCHDALEANRPLIEQMGHELTAALPSQPVYVDVDALRITQVLSNLLSNAAKYTEAGGHVWLNAERQGNDAVVTVKDNGVGIPAEMLTRVFDLFSQAHESLERSRGGLGLGLALAQQLTEMHDGSIEVRSGGAGKGSEFTVRLPCVAGEDQPIKSERCEKGNRAMVP